MAPDHLKSASDLHMAMADLTAKAEGGETTIKTGKTRNGKTPRETTAKISFQGDLDATPTAKNVQNNPVTGTGTIIDDFTKKFLNETVPVEKDPESLMPDFPTPISNERIGGKLKHYLLNWKLITNDLFTLNVIQNGYKPQLKEKPPLVRNPAPHEYDLNEEHLQALDAEVDNFLQNNVIEPVQDLNSPGFYSCLFVRPRSNDSPNRWRCIFDISQLNKYLVAPRFRMESANSIRNLLKLNNYAVKIDLSDAFLHVPLHPSFKKYMRFFHRGKAYQFRTICFGANFSPYIFSYLINSVMKFFHKYNIDIAAYLDDMINQHPVPATLKHQINYVAQVLSFLGWTVNFKKSILEPLQLMDYIGLHLEFQTGKVYPPQDRWDKIQLLATEFLTLTSATAKKWCSLLGLLTSCQDLTPMGRLWLRPLQNHLNQYWWNRKKLYIKIPVDSMCKHAITWWLNPANVMTGVPWTHPPPDLTIYTDSSDTGWGGTLDNQKVSGKWDQTFVMEHINLKELMAVWKTILHFQHQLSGKSILVASDNTSTVCYLNKLGGTKSQKLLDLTVKILLWCQDHNIHLRARHIPGRFNVISDQLSRLDQIITTEWSIHHNVIDQISKTWENPLIDLFATKYNHKLPVYFSPVPDNQAQAVDAMSQDWSNLTAYAYPPQALLQQVLNKIRDQPCTVYLIAPAWSSRSWYPSLLSLLVDKPRKITPHPKLLKQPLSGIFHKNPGQLDLHVWKLSGNVSKQKGFLRAQPKASQSDVEALQIGYMRSSGKNTPVGVINGKLITSTSLNNK